MSLKILILGVNGFIGSHLTDHILAKKDWKIYGMDLANANIQQHLQNPRLHFMRGDITVDTAWVEEQIKKCDVVFPLVAIATPATYVQNPLRVFELDFEANLAVVRLCVKHKKHVVFPSTSEVYGMCPDEEFNEETSSLVLGPISKPRWIYSCCKQLLDRVIQGYGARDAFPYTLFRPFNWLGPRLDNIKESRAGGSRVVTQFAGNILRGEDIKLVDGGAQRRCFTYIDDGVDALLDIIEQREQGAYQRIFNVGNPYPENELSIRELAELLISLVKTYPAYAAAAEKTQLIDVPSEAYYGAGYQDVTRRVPSIKNAEQYLGWKPQVDIKTALKKTLDFYLK